jgi:hypothetical protein
MISATHHYHLNAKLYMLLPLYILNTYLRVGCMPLNIITHVKSDQKTQFLSVRLGGFTCLSLYDQQRCPYFAEDMVPGLVIITAYSNWNFE